MHPLITMRKYCDALVLQPFPTITLRVPRIRPTYPDEEVLRLVFFDIASDPSWVFLQRSPWFGFMNMTATYVQRSTDDANRYRVRQASVSAQTVTTCAEFSWPEPVEHVLCAFQGLAFVETESSDVLEVDAHHVTVCADLDCFTSADLFSVSDKVVDMHAYYKECYYLEDRRARFAWIAGCVL
jgi:hypothetical protein